MPSGPYSKINRPITNKDHLVLADAAGAQRTVSPERLGQWMTDNGYGGGGGPLLVQEFSNTNVTVNEGVNRVLQTGSLTGLRVVTLPAASAYAQGETIEVTDVSGTITSTRYINITRASAADTINNASAGVPIRASFGSVIFMSDGANGWFTVQPEVVEEAVQNGLTYGRRNGAWVQLDTSGGEQTYLQQYRLDVTSGAGLHFYPSGGANDQDPSGSGLLLQMGQDDLTIKRIEVFYFPHTDFDGVGFDEFSENRIEWSLITMDQYGNQQQSQGLGFLNFDNVDNSQTPNFYDYFGQTNNGYLNSDRQNFFWQAADLNYNIYQSGTHAHDQNAEWAVLIPSEDSYISQAYGTYYFNVFYQNQDVPN